MTQSHPSMKYCFAIFTTAGLLLLVACGQVEPQRQLAKDALSPAFFDLKAYFEQEVQRLSQSKPQVFKKVTINGAEEQQNLEQIDFQQELQVFAQSDINRPNWLEKYHADTTFFNGHPSRILYKAMEEKLRTRLIDIEFEQNTVSKITIQNGGKSIVAGSQQELIYLPQSGYLIKSHQTTALSKDKDLSIEVRFRD